MERKTRFELATFSLATRRSTTELFPHKMVEGRGFEPLKASPADLQSAPFGQLGHPSTIFNYSIDNSLS